MSLKTKLLELFKYEPETDGAQTFNIKSALNDNWDKIEAWAQSVKTTLAGLVPTSRKVNGKALTKDVTLTAADIKMPDSDEDVGEAMAKRPLMQYPKTLDVHKITSGQLYWCDADTSNTPYKAGLTEYQQGVALCTARSAAEKWCSIIYIVHADKSIWIQSSDQGGWRDWVQLAKCETPEAHELPLANGWLTYGTSINWYSKDQFDQVTIYFRLKSTVTAITDGIVIANIPEGFRPQHDMSIPGLLTFDNYTRLHCHVDIGPSGALQLYVDGTAPSGRSVIELTCTEFHYPAK